MVKQEAEKSKGASVSVKNEFFSRDDMKNVSLGSADNPTFAGVLFRDDVFKFITDTGYNDKWGDSTAYSYLVMALTYVFPGLEGKSMLEITKQDFEKIIDDVIHYRAKHRDLYKARADLQCKENIKRLIMRVCKACDKLGICKDPMYGSSYKIGLEGTEGDVANNSRVVPKSIKPEIEYMIAEQLFTKDTVCGDGEVLGVAIMDATGFRENEACAVQFKDLKPFICDPQYMYLVMYKSAKGRRDRTTKYSGKTMNANRLMPIPDKLKKLLLLRIDFLKSKGFKREEIDKMPIACHGQDYLVACTPEELGTAGTDLLRSLQGFSDELEVVLEYIDRDIKEAVRGEDGIDYSNEEKDPTAYLFRRNFGTHLTALGFTKVEKEYLMGHEMVSDTDRRNFYNNEDLLYRLARRLHERPYLNYESKDGVIDYSTIEGKLEIKDANDVMISLPANEKNYVYDLRLKEKDPNGGLKVTFFNEKPDEVRLEGRYTTEGVSDTNTNPANNLTFYKEVYRRAAEKMKAKIDAATAKGETQSETGVQMDSTAEGDQEGGQGNGQSASDEDNPPSDK